MTPSRNEKSFRPTRAVVNLSRVRANFRLLRKIAQAPLALGSPVFQCPMVKANAYGHGDIGVSRALRAEGAEFLGVALTEEGVRLRENADRGGILVFGAFSTEAEAKEMLNRRLTPVVGDWAQLDALKSALSAVEERVEVHFEFNTGMNRLGFEYSEAPRVRQWLDAHPRFKLQGVCTHLLRGDDASSSAEFGESYSDTQLRNFKSVLDAFRGLKFFTHVLNSSGSAAFWKRDSNILKEYAPLGARPGIAIYGIEPSSEKDLQLGLQPVLSWMSRLVHVHHIAQGSIVSYNATWKASRASLIGVVPVGYADGYSRALSNRGSVLCRGYRVPIVGTVCMDYFMVDLTDVEAATGPIDQGENILLIGEQNGAAITAQEIADLRGTIAYEVLTNISERVPRTYVEGDVK
jgi:alanine racemase